MKVLGISPLDKDSTVAIVADGEVLFAAAEERFSRVKQQAGFPQQALAAALEATGLGPGDIDLVAYPFLTATQEIRLFGKSLAKDRAAPLVPPRAGLARQLAAAERRVPARDRPINGLAHPNERLAKNLAYGAFYRLAGPGLLAGAMTRRGSHQWEQEATLGHRRWQAVLDESLAALGLGGKVKRMEHHASHAANAFFTSGFERALCVTLDGYGSGLAGSVSLGEGGRIKRLHGLEFPHSLGTFYEHVTSSLGLKPSRHEGKVVGLAAYGDPSVLQDVLLGRFEQTPGNFRMADGNNIHFARHLAVRFPKIDVAAAYQRVLEIVAGNYVKYWLDKTGCDTLVLSGGVTANVKMNQRLYELDGVRHLFVYPNMGDGGCGTGAALYHSWPGGTRPAIEHVYLGPGFTPGQVRAALDAAGLAYTEPRHLAGEVARLIHGGKVVARFDGRMEYGPRALGNRSILYHGREPAVNQWLNQRLGRTEFMPFAPVTLWEARERCYHRISGAEHAAEFMTITFDCTEVMKQQCPAAVHVDGTARPQLIRREVNPGYYDILKEYEQLAGIPSLINTSFNMHEEPIVCTPADAVRAFLQGRLDYLAIGPYLASHPATSAH